MRLGCYTPTPVAVWLLKPLRPLAPCPSCPFPLACLLPHSPSSLSTDSILRVAAPRGSNLIEVRGEGGGWGEEGGVEEWRSYQAPQKAGALGERVSVGEGERVSVGEGERVSVGEGERVNVGEGERVSVGEGERVSVGEGERVSVGEGERVSVGEGEQIVRVVASHGSNLIEVT
ncbi:unnamed protein product [Closterium sp. NIES-65]|nr:unnamed protein product [Closterium sp. NIES-65]